MKKLVFKTFIYLTILVLINALLFFGLYLSRKDEIVKLPKQNIVIGDSNTRNAIDDKIVTDFKNLSQGGESYLFAYNKLKYLLQKDNKIDTLLLAFAPHNVINNNWIDGDREGNLRYRMSEYFFIYSPQDHYQLIKGNPYSYFNSLHYVGESFYNNIQKNKQSDLKFLGGFMPNPKIQNTENYIPFPKKEAVFNKLEINYLQKIVSLCKDKNIHLIFITTPKNFRRSDFKNYDAPEFYQFYTQNYSKTDYLNFNKLPLCDSCYADINHLSYLGAEEFSTFLKKNSVKKLLQSNYNQKED